MNRIVSRINTILNESSVTIDKMSVDGKVKGKIKVNVGDTVGFKAGSKPAKGKNKFDMEAGTIDDIKGDLVHINSDEEGSFWMRIDDLYWEAEDKIIKRGVSEQDIDNIKNDIEEMVTVSAKIAALMVNMADTAANSKDTDLDDPKQLISVCRELVDGITKIVNASSLSPKTKNELKKEASDFDSIVKMAKSALGKNESRSINESVLDAVKKFKDKVTNYVKFKALTTKMTAHVSPMLMRVALGKMEWDDFKKEYLVYVRDLLSKSTMGDDHKNAFNLMYIAIIPEDPKPRRRR